VIPSRGQTTKAAQDLLEGDPGPPAPGAPVWTSKGLDALKEVPSVIRDDAPLLILARTAFQLLALSTSCDPLADSNPEYWPKLLDVEFKHPQTGAESFLQKLHPAWVRHDLSEMYRRLSIGDVSCGIGRLLKALPSDEDARRWARERSPYVGEAIWIELALGEKRTVRILDYRARIIWELTVLQAGGCCS
jgi:hypothetical protein